MGVVSMAAVSARLFYAGANEETYHYLHELCSNVDEFNLRLERVTSYEQLLEKIFTGYVDLFIVDESLARPERLFQLQILDANNSSLSFALIGHSVREARWSNWKHDRFHSEELTVGELTGAIRHTLHRQSLRAEVNYRLSYERLANEVISSFVEMRSAEIDATVTKALKSVGQFAEVEHSFVCLFSTDGTIVERTHHWSALVTRFAPGSFFDRVSVAQLPWFIEKIKRNCIVSFTNHDELAAASVSERAYFSSTDVNALITVPLQRRGKVIGFLGFSSPRKIRSWTKEDVELLQLMGRLFVTAIERRFSEDARRESEVRFRTVVESLSDGVLVLDSENKLEFVNEKFISITGYSASELALEQPFSKMLDAEDAERIALEIESFSRQASDSAVREFRMQVRRADGENRWMTIAAAPFRLATGALRGTVAAFRDVTDQQALEEQLKHAQKMEAVGRLAGGVAHDFNNVLTAVLGYSGLLLNRLPKDHPNRHEILQIRKASEQAGGLVTQLLTFSRKQAHTPKVLSLNTIITETLPMLSRLLGENIELTPDLDEFLCRVKIDPSQFQQILLNLVINARDAMPGGGTLTVQTSTARIPSEGRSSLPGVPAGDYAMLLISDTGSGMTQNVKEHLFEPFFTTKEQGKGTGLGLATVYGNVQSSGGFISVQSELGRGSSFRILFPRVADKADFQPLKNSQEALRTGSETILLVEDEESVRNLLSEVLEMSGYRVLQASHGREAVRCSRKFEEPIHLLVTDVVMPHMGGRETAERICRFRKETKVLVISGYLNEGSPPPQFGNQPCKLLEKPFTPYDFSLAVREALDAPTRLSSKDFSLQGAVAPLESGVLQASIEK